MLNVFDLLGYDIVKDTGRRFYLVHRETGRRSTIGVGPRDEQWLMGGDWMTEEQIARLPQRPSRFSASC